ncbi:MAG: deoxyribonuclease IV [Candidatus Magasanikbacteria bacterium]
MKLGAHLSISNGFSGAVREIHEIGGNCLQIFSSPPQSWQEPDIENIDVEEFQSVRKDLGVDPFYFHASYLINLADDGRVGHLSKKLLKKELKVASKLDIKGSVIHVGTFKDRSNESVVGHEDFGILVNNIQEVLSDSPEDTLFLIENSGNRKVAKFLEEISVLLAELESDRVKVCLDTAHLHGAGYDLKSKENFKNFLEKFKETIEFKNLELWHLNDSKAEFGSFRDEHENIGEGRVGLEVFENILNHEKFRDLPFIIETPGFDEKGPDKKNLDKLKELVKK